jgi:hypothetical protein
LEAIPRFYGHRGDDDDDEDGAFVETRLKRKQKKNKAQQVSLCFSDLARMLGEMQRASSPLANGICPRE